MIITSNRLRPDSWRRKTWLFTVMILLRFTTGMHLVDSGLRKMMGERHVPATDRNLLYFLDGIFQLGFYWSWVGLIELLAAVLLMGQRFAAAGALLCLFIASNVSMFGISIGWGRITPQLLVLCSAVLLLFWDQHKLRPLFVPEGSREPMITEPFPEAQRTWQHAGIALFFIAIAGFVFRETFPLASIFIHRLVTLSFFLIACSCLYVTELKRKKGMPAIVRPIRSR